MRAQNICTVILDVRCLQDPAYAQRGVGRHALGLLRHAPGDVRMVGLIDPALPPLMNEAQTVLNAVCPNAYAAAEAASAQLSSRTCFVAFSPMTHDPLFAARLLADRRLRRAAVVHDFIPRRVPERYLPDPAHRLAYATALRWLARCDIFLPNSRGTADELSTLLGVPASAMVVTGCALDPVFEGAQGTTAGQRHVLVIGGGDPRKNPEVVIRAHARSGAMQRGAGIPLVICGSYGEADAQAFRAAAAAAGGRPELVEVPGHVPDATLLEIYGRALAIVCPSRDEGFSLPVIEGMAAGAPCLASDIPAHRELVEDPSQLFAPDDNIALAAALDRVLMDPGWRETVLARQAAMWPRFRAREVAWRFWGTVLGPSGACSPTAVARPAVLRGRRPRVALLSPLPPDRSGVADYTAATCAELGRLVELHAFTGTEWPAFLPGAASVRPMSALPHLMPDFDRVLSVIGNSHYHLRIHEALLRYGGACIAHDARMLGFYRILLGQERALTVASRELGRPIASAELDDWLADESRLEALFLGEIAESASPTIVHSSVTARLFQERYGITPAYLPFSTYRTWGASELTPEARAAARERLGIPDGELAIATFGFVHFSKAPEECVWALDVLRGWGLPASLHFVGGTNHTSDGAGIRALAARLGLVDRVRFAEDYVSEQAYRDYLVGVDLGVQLRTFGMGALSGALLDCIAAGLPTVTNAGLGAAVGVPESYVRCIPDALSPLLLAEALVDLLAAGVAARRPEEERSAFSRMRSFAAYARGLCRALDLDVPIANIGSAGRVAA